MKIHFITCARKGSKRLIDKNIKEIAGAKLIEYTFDFELSADYINNVR